MDAQDFLSVVETNPAVVGILERANELDVPDWYLTAGGLFQTVWNFSAGLDPQTGIRDYDFFYFDDSDLSYEAKTARWKSVWPDLTVVPWPTSI